MKTMVSKAKAFLKARHSVVREAMRQLGVDAILLTHTPDIAYLTDFNGEDSFAVFTDKELHLISDFRYQEQAECECGWVKFTLREGKMADSLAKVLGQIKAGKLGFDADWTTVATLDSLVKALKEGKVVQPDLVPLERPITNIRKVKDDNEIDLIRKSVNIAEEAYVATRELIKPGLSENHIAGILVSELRSRGAMMESFPPIVAAGAHSSLPHYRPGECSIQKDAPLLIDWGALYRGYCSDITRTLLLGRVNPKIKEIYRICYEAQQEVLRFMRPGVTTVEADSIARDVITKAGYGTQFGHGLGHGIGREIHEYPVLRKTGPSDELRPGMVVTVEPGIYLKGIGGVRIEDDILITHSGCEVLTSLGKTYEECHVE
jgi:Xaa-Pro aminopeptidase